MALDGSNRIVRAAAAAAAHLAGFGSGGNKGLDVDVDSGQIEVLDNGNLVAEGEEQQGKDAGVDEDGEADGGRAALDRHGIGDRDGGAGQLKRGELGGKKHL